MKRMFIHLIILAAFLLPQLSTGQIPSPKDHLGFEVGDAKKLADMHQILDYFHRLDAASDRIVVERLGETTEGNPFIVACITAINNHENLKTYQTYQQRLADPRSIDDDEAEKIIAKGKTVVMINCSIHATEIGASQMALKLAYDLAAKDDPNTQEILDNVILLFIPMHNPDGIQKVVDWYYRHLGTKYEGCGLPWLYHKYAGHDINRDWYMFTQIESQLTLKIFHAWHPQIVVDLHQMESHGARMFVPPYTDPFEPNVDPIIQQQVAMLGSFIASELTAEGKPGVIHSQYFDAWTPGRAYPHYHGGVRILTETASARIASPISIKFEQLSSVVRTSSVNMPFPWHGGDWTLKDIVEYDYSAAKAVLINAARLRENWLRNFYRIHKKAVNRTDPPFAFIVPLSQRDLAATIKMLQTLRLGQVEIHQASAEFIADGQKFPAGSFIIYLAQPYGGYAKALLEQQFYPEIKYPTTGQMEFPYDVVAHNLPLLMGVDVVPILKPFQVICKKLDPIPKPNGLIDLPEDLFGYIWSYQSNDDVILVNRLMKQDYQVYWTAVPLTTVDGEYPPGTLVVTGTKAQLAAIPRFIGDLAVHLTALEKRPRIQLYRLKPARLGIYQSWTANIDEGWTRWVLEQFEFSFQQVKDQNVRNGHLNRWLDVIIIPSLSDRSIVQGNSVETMPIEFCGGIGEQGVNHLRAFVQQGGTLIAMNRAADFAIRQFNLAIRNSVQDLDRSDFFVPGSILRVQVNNHHPIGYGFERQSAIFFWNSPVFEGKQGISVINYASDKLLLSGWLTGMQYLANRSALIDVPIGRGKIVLIGFPALFRGQAYRTFRFLFNAIFYATAEQSDFAQKEDLTE